MRRDEISVPYHAADAAETRSLPSRRRRRIAFTPYLLLLPVVAALFAVLAYPSYKLVRISFERYGLFELIQKQGHWIGLDNFDSVLHDRVFWDTVVRTVIFTIVNVGSRSCSGR
jgi:ABC-type sugar transport system permease subunit